MKSPLCYRLLLLVQYLLLSLVLTFEAVELDKRSAVYHIDEGERVSVECFITCSDNSNYTAKWIIQIPNLRNYGKFDLDDSTIIKLIKTKYGIEFGFRNESIPCISGNEARFYLDITGLKATMSHSVVHCGEGESPITYAEEAMYIIVHQMQPVVMATSEVQYATDSGVTVSCQHSCNWTSLYPNYQLLWKLQTFNPQLGTLELHDNASQVMAEDELNVSFTMTSNDSCDTSSKWNTFSLDILGMSDQLQQAVVSCGVRVDQNSPQVYSDKDTYIIINETDVTTKAIAMTTNARTTTNVGTTPNSTDPPSSPNSTDPPSSLSPDRLAAAVAPTAIVFLLFGLGIGAGVTGLIVYLRPRRTEPDKLAVETAVHYVEENEIATTAMAATNPLRQDMAIQDTNENAIE